MSLPPVLSSSPTSVSPPSKRSTTLARSAPESETVAAGADDANASTAHAGRQTRLSSASRLRSPRGPFDATADNRAGQTFSRRRLTGLVAPCARTARHPEWDFSGASIEGSPVDRAECAPHDLSVRLRALDLPSMVPVTLAARAGVMQLSGSRPLRDVGASCLVAPARSFCQKLADQAAALPRSANWHRCRITERIGGNLRASRFRGPTSPRRREPLPERNLHLSAAPWRGASHARGRWFEPSLAHAPKPACERLRAVLY